MIALRSFSGMAIGVVLSVALVACGSDKSSGPQASGGGATSGPNGSGGTAGSTVRTQTLTYRYVENGCDTGTHTFHSFESYCEGLRDNDLNQNCAWNLRARRFESVCTGSFEKSVPSEETRSGREDVSIAAPAQDASRVPSPVPPPQERVQVSEVTILAKPVSLFEFRPQTADSKTVSNLSGQLDIVGATPEPAQLIRLAGAESVTIVEPEMTDCRLDVQNFTNARIGERVNFTLVGIDEQSSALTGCLAKLALMRMQGFTAQFKNVPTGMLEQGHIPLVTLQVRMQ